MSHVFISYKREDEVRVGRLIEALRKSGVEVWTDHELPPGEPYRTVIARALDAAYCVLVVWTRNSVGADNAFVLDEATHGQQRGILVPVRMDRVQEPLGFAQLQSLDLVHWRGALKDPFFIDLLAAIEAKRVQGPAPRPHGPTARIRRRLLASSLGTSGVLAAALLIGSVDRGYVATACGAQLAQPWMSDACGELGIGGRASRTERLAWEGREAGSCAALRTHIQQFPQGAHRDEAVALLTARVVTEDVLLKPDHSHVLALAVPRYETNAAREVDARSQAERAGLERARRMCQDFAASGAFEYDGARTEWAARECRRSGGSWACEYEGRARCELRVRVVIRNEHCPAAVTIGRVPPDAGS